MPFPVSEQISTDIGALSCSGTKFQTYIDPLSNSGSYFHSIISRRNRKELQNEAAKQCFTGNYNFGAFLSAKTAFWMVPMNTMKSFAAGSVGTATTLWVHRKNRLRF